MPEDDPTQPNERLGRWIPRYSGPAHRGSLGRFRRDGADFEIVGTLAVLGLLAILALVGVIVADLPRADSRSDSPHGALPVPPEFSMPPFLPPLLSAPPPSASPDPASPLPPGSVAGAPLIRAPIGTAPAAYEPGPARPPATSPPGSGAPGTTAPSTASLIADTTVSLESVRQPGNRVRHKKFRARLDPIGPDSSATARADATFLVRGGLAGGRGCVSLEASNYPHRFLRHQNFAVYLQPDDGSALFAADATFCPVPVEGSALVLRSVNFPKRYVTVRDSLLYLDPVSAGAALALSVRSPLVSTAALEDADSSPGAAHADHIAGSVFYP